MQYGIIQLNKLIEASCAVANVAAKVLEDGKVNAADLTQVFNIFQALQRFADIKFYELPNEVKDLSADELAKLMEAFKKSFDIPQDKIEGKVEQGLDLAIKLYMAIMQIVKFAQEIKK